MKNHRIIEKSHTSEFWKEGRACGRDEDPDQILVHVSGSTVFTFDREDSKELAKLKAILDEAFERGRAHKLKEIRGTLGITSIVNI